MTQPISAPRLSRLRPAIAFLIILFLTASCKTEPGLDKAKFADLYGAGQELKAAISAGRACDLPDTLRDRFASGIAAATGKTASKAERDLLSAYTNLLVIYKDGRLLCRTRTLLSDFPFMPKGRIYVPQELDPIVDKYDLPTEKHLYKPTGKYWRSIPEDSINVVWRSAEAELQHIENMVKYSE